jgi:hypothetical protein
VYVKLIQYQFWCTRCAFRCIWVLHIAIHHWKQKPTRKKKSLIIEKSMKTILTWFNDLHKRMTVTAFTVITFTLLNEYIMYLKHHDWSMSDRQILTTLFLKEIERLYQHEPKFEFPMFILPFISLKVMYMSRCRIMQRLFDFNCHEYMTYYCMLYLS